MYSSRQSEFLETLWEYYAHHGRDLPWRQPRVDGVFDPYVIMVSELMLQQTQVARVIPKLHEFLENFPSIQSLAGAELGDVLRVWQGLGYNRRAKYLHEAAKATQELGAFPDTIKGLIALPGIGTDTAGAILAYAYDQPTLFVETNVRTVYLHHFFEGRTDVSDKAIVEKLEQTLDHEHPREFYWAIMDYGTHLKATVGNLNVASKHYVKQSSFIGSRRQVRGAIIRALSSGGKSLSELRETVTDERLESVLDDLVTEGMVRADSGVYLL